MIVRHDVLPSSRDDAPGFFRSVRNPGLCGRATRIGRLSITTATAYRPQNVLPPSTKLERDRTWKLYRQAGCTPYWVMTAVMAAMWLGGTLLYGVAADRMGEMGPSLGWAAWNAVMILVSVACGLLLGEWRAATRASLQMLAAGTLVLLVSVALLGWAGAGAM